MVHDILLKPAKDMRKSTFEFLKSQTEMIYHKIINHTCSKFIKIIGIASKMQPSTKYQKYLGNSEYKEKLLSELEAIVINDYENYGNNIVNHDDKKDDESSVLDVSSSPIVQNVNECLKL